MPENFNIAVVGIGATGTVIAAALLRHDPETLLVDPNPALNGILVADGLHISGAITCDTAVKNFVPRIAETRDFNPDLIFIASKTFHLPRILDEIETVFKPGTKLVSTHNGLGTEDLIAERFGADAAFRMSLNLGVSLKGPGLVEAAFFNKPNHLGGLVPENRESGLKITKILSDSGLETEFVDDIKFYVWKKMIMKCSMAALCAVTDMTLTELLESAPTREIAEASFAESLAVAKAKGYDLGEDYLDQALAYLAKVGGHKDSICVDIANNSPTEIDFLGGKVVEYGRETGVPTPVFSTMTNLVKGIEKRQNPPK